MINDLESQKYAIMMTNKKHKEAVSYLKGEMQELERKRKNIMASLDGFSMN